MSRHERAISSTFAAVAVLTMAVAALACQVLALRITWTDPAEAVRGG